MTSQRKLLSSLTVYSFICTRRRAGDDDLYGDNDETDCEDDNGDPVPCPAGNDELYGNAGDDLLHGGPQNDLGDGGPNFDTCVNVETVKNCEA